MAMNLNRASLSLETVNVADQRRDRTRGCD